ncbi:PRC-barrel domain-containing protein [Geodermatophilus sp. SYSU D01186]
MSRSDTAGWLVRLSETNLTVADPAADVRGRRAVDKGGQEVGTVDDLLVDDQENKVRLLRIGAGGFLGMGKEHFLVPVEAVTSVDRDTVTIDRGRERLGDVPAYDPALAYDDAYYSDVYGWWGYGPYWQAGSVYPPR